MSAEQLYGFNPYQRFIFWPLWILSIVLTALISGVLYYLLAQQVLTHTQYELRQIATKTAALIPTEIHEKLQGPSDQNSEDYQLLELYFKSIISANADVDDVYTLRPTDDPEVMTFVVSGKDTTDENKDGVIDETEQKAMLGEKYDVTQAPKLREALDHPTYDDAITYDKWGAWLSGYAPLKNDKGEVVGVVGIDYKASVVSAERQSMFKIIIYINLLLIIPYGFLSWLTSRRVGRPYRILAEAMDRVIHGDIHYKIQPKKKAEEFMIADLFNNMRDVLLKTCQRAVKKEDNKIHSA